MAPLKYKLCTCLIVSAVQEEIIIYQELDSLYTGNITCRLFYTCQGYTYIYVDICQERNVALSL